MLIDLNGNQIEVLRDIFSSSSRSSSGFILFKTLSYIFLNNNKIKTIEDRAFYIPNPGMIEINLENNLIPELKGDIDFGSLKVLNLNSKNPIIFGKQLTERFIKLEKEYENIEEENNSNDEENSGNEVIYYYYYY